MVQVLVVGLGGFFGTTTAYALDCLIVRQTSGWRFPASTIAVNAVGCLIAGVLIGLIETRGWFSANARLFLFTGFLSGFTTFSAFGLEVVQLLRRGEASVAAANVAASVLLCVLAVWVGAASVFYFGGVPEPPSQLPRTPA